MTELRTLFALMLGSKRKYVDPTRAVQVCAVALQFLQTLNNVLTGSLLLCGLKFCSLSPRVCFMKMNLL